MAKRSSTPILVLTDLANKPFRPQAADVRYWTHVINHLIFDGSLPEWRNIAIKPRLRKVFAETHAPDDGEKKYCDLLISGRFSSFSAFFSILAHEMLHLAEQMKLGAMHHGKFFFSYKEILAKIGVKLKVTY